MLQYIQGELLQLKLSDTLFVVVWSSASRDSLISCLKREEIYMITSPLAFQSSSASDNMKLWHEIPFFIRPLRPTISQYSPPTLEGITSRILKNVLSSLLLIFSLMLPFLGKNFVLSTAALLGAHYQFSALIETTNEVSLKSEVSRETGSLIILNCVETFLLLHLSKSWAMLVSHVKSCFEATFTRRVKRGYDSWQQCFALPFNVSRHQGTKNHGI